MQMEVVLAIGGGMGEGEIVSCGQGVRCGGVQRGDEPTFILMSECSQPIHQSMLV